MGRSSGSRRSRHSAPSEMVTVGVALAALWAVQAATTEVSGAWFLRLPLLFGMAAALLFWRMSSPNRRRRAGHKHGVTLGVWCWAIAASFSAVLNWQVSGVPLAYIGVFLAGGLIYCALSGLRFTMPDLDVAATGLAIGASVPAVATLLSSLDGYSIGRFGLHHDSAAFLLIVVPILVGTVVDRRKRLTPRIVCGAALLPIAISITLLNLRMALVAALILSAAVVTAFKLGVRRLPAIGAALVTATIVVLTIVDPEIGAGLVERWTPALTIVSAPPHPVSSLPGSLRDEWLIALGFWLLGSGPGTNAAVAMETGVLGFFSAALLTFGVWTSLARAARRGPGDQANDARFMLLIGPATYLAYAIIASPISNMATVNTWTVLVASMLALMPPFGRRVRAQATQPEPAGTPSDSSSDFAQRPQSVPSLARS